MHGLIVTACHKVLSDNVSIATVLDCSSANWPRVLCYTEIIFMCQSLRYLRKYIEVRNILKYVSGIKVLRPVHVRYNWFLSIFLRESNVTNIILYKYCVNLCSHHCDRLCSKSPAIVLSELTLFFPSKHQTLQWTSL